MAWDNTTTELHLTPYGWKTGNRPAEAVLTISEHIYQRAGWSEEKVTSSKTIDDLAKRFPR